MAGISPREAGYKNSIDVIVQYTKDGDIIPLRIRLEDEDGMIQTFSVKGYRKLVTGGEFELPNGVRAYSDKKAYEVKICVLGIERTIRLFFDNEKWYLR